MNREGIFNEAINLWGIEAQEDMAIEEMSELIKSLLKHRRNACVKTHKDLIEELADVEIMISQLKQIYLGDVDNFIYFNDVAISKMTRLEKMVEEAKKIKEALK